MRIPNKILGHTLTPAERVRFIKNGLNRDLIKYRIKKGWDRSEWFRPKVRLKGNVVINRNIVSDERLKMPKQEVIEVIGRIKYLNKQPETKGVICIPLRVLVRAKEYGVDINAVEELKV